MHLDDSILAAPRNFLGHRQLRSRIRRGDFGGLSSVARHPILQRETAMNPARLNRSQGIGSRILATKAHQPLTGLRLAGKDHAEFPFEFSAILRGQPIRIRHKRSRRSQGSEAATKSGDVFSDAHERRYVGATVKPSSPLRPGSGQTRTPYLCDHCALSVRKSDVLSPHAKVAKDAKDTNR